MRYWHEYVKGTRLDQQTVQSTIGSLIYLALKDFYKFPEESRKYGELVSLFAKRWGKGYGPHDEREYWLEKAHVALKNAYELNLNLKPHNMEMEIGKSIPFPFENPLYQLESTTDRIDWYSNSEYCLVDYKWDEKTLSEEEEAVDFQTVLYYITWTGYMKGIPPKLISYQFLTPGIQRDVAPTVTIMEAGIDRLFRYIERAENLKKQATEPEATL